MKELLDEVLKKYQAKDEKMESLAKLIADQKYQINVLTQEKNKAIHQLSKVESKWNKLQELIGQVKE